MKFKKDNPDDREFRTKEYAGGPNSNDCKIDQCKYFKVCNKKQIPENGVKCINYKYFLK